MIGRMGSRLLERLGVELPVVQAGMGGGVATGELAGEVSRAGGLGTVGSGGPAADLRAALADARERADGSPVAANLLLPFARQGHFEAAAAADAVVTFWGRPRRRTPGVWLHQCGSIDEALASERAGADGVIVQGREAGGHVRGTMPALDLLAQARLALPKDYPVLMAGGMADAEDVAEALAAGADAAVLGTRFVMSDESGARAAYKQRLQEARETVVTELFGVGWPAAPHRVLWNEAAERWLSRNRRGPAWVRALNRVSAPLTRLSPPGMQARVIRAQRPDRPFFTPSPPAEGTPKNLLDAGALYAGESVARIWDVRPAAELTRELARA
jgi:NAD(P)H-dependent flavin oxidoreductase YrpB (nitropropane dioxygenase family)